MFPRVYDQRIKGFLTSGKVLILYGPRQVGKTTLIHVFLKNYQGKYYLGNGEDRELTEILSSQRIRRLKAAFEGYDLVIIDEAQRIHDIGTSLKLLADHLPRLKIFVTGSSSFSLVKKLGEPLTGRQRILILYPLSVMELKTRWGGISLLERLEELLVYGFYPEVLNTVSSEEKREYLLTLRDSYMLKDILELENVRNSRKVFDLLRLIAFQIGKEVSWSELSNALGVAKQTVERYLDLLEKTFVIKRIGGFSRNLRKEVTKTARYYFYDNGLRNAVLNDFRYPEARNDLGQLWENFVIMERLKKQAYMKIFSNNYFWRTYDKKEIDWVEERDGKLFGYEIKWKPKKTKPPALWAETYTDAEFQVITSENFLEFVS